MTGSFAVLLMMLAALGVCALHGIQTLGGSVDVVVNSTARKMELAASMDSDAHKMRVHATMAEISLLNSMSRTLAGVSAEEAPCAACHTADRVTTHREAFAALGGKILQEAAAMRPLMESREEQTSLDTIQAGVGDWTPLYSKYLDLAAANQYTKAHEIMVGQIYPLLPKIDEAADGLYALQTARMRQAGAASTRLVSLGFWQVSVAMLLGVLAGVVGLSLVRRVGAMLRASTGQLLEMSRGVASAAGELAQSNEALAQGASQHAASLQETSAAARVASTMTQKNAIGTRDVANLVDAEARVVEEANGKLRAMLASMQEIVAAGEKTSAIVKTIDGLAFQTNLLALNASVEAARAGQAGLGFAVVAQEVRTLAQSSAQAARDTAQLVSDSVDAGNSGREQLDAVAVTMRGITESTVKIKALMGEVNQVGQEQALCLAQIARAMEQMDKVTSQTAASAEQRAAATQELSAQSQTMRDIVLELAATV